MFLVFDIIVILYIFNRKRKEINVDAVLKQLDKFTQAGKFNDAANYALEQSKEFRKVGDEFRSIFFLARATYFGAIAGNRELIQYARPEMEMRMNNYINSILQNNKIRDRSILIEKLGKLAKHDKKAENVLKLWLMTIVSDMTYMYLYSDMENVEEKIKVGLELLDYGEPSNQITFLSIASRCYAKLGNLDEAIKFSKRSIQIGRDNNDPSLFVPDMINLGNYYAYSGKVDLAIDTWREAAKVSKQNKLTYNFVMAEGNIANVYINSGKFQDAKTLVQNEIFPFVKNAQIIDSYIDTLCLLSDIEYIENNLEKSIEYIRNAKSLILDKNIKNRADVVFSKLVSREFSAGYSKEAMRSFEEYLKFINETENPYVYSLKALLNIDSKDENVEQFIERAIDIAQKTNNVQPLIFAYNIKLKILLRNNAFDATVEVLDHAEEIAEKTKNQIMKMEIGVVKSLVYALQGKNKESQNLLNNIYDSANNQHFTRILKLVDTVKPILNAYYAASTGYAKVKDKQKPKEILSEDIRSYIELVSRRVQA